MLILTRTVGSAITIGDDITVVVKRITGNQVQLGIDAPKEVAITRDDAVCREPKLGWSIAVGADGKIGISR